MRKDKLVSTVFKNNAIEIYTIIILKNPDTLVRIKEIQLFHTKKSLAASAAKL
ncbi:hypothetical protein ABP1_0886 [Bacillus subtilis]|nr:hypothetical protein ABP1_0886 [Bacillus subtilis]